MTPGALVIAGLQLGLSLVWLLADQNTKLSMSTWLEATPANVFAGHRVWTLVTGVFLQRSFIALLLDMFVLWQLAPVLERFWGTPRFYRFFAITSLVATCAGVSFGYLLGGMHQLTPISGIDPFINAVIVAFGIIYAKQPVQLFGTLPLTARQLMYGILAFLTLSLVLQQAWVNAVAYGAAIGAAVLMTSKRWSPGLAWKRWRIQRQRAKLTVMAGGKGHVPPVREEQKWLN